MKARILHDISGETALAALIIAVVALMVLPLPTIVIDLLLTVNIAISIVLLMVTMYTPNTASLFSFPSLLLFTTLFRLSLNIASTKSILLHAQAGHIIDSFGKLVVGGNLVVGLVVFLIITTVQFIVIAKGSERVAEVGARFTLDAMPGKQMSIDADVRAGNLNAEEAQRRRALLATESQMHGGMDGAMKFVKGDAIAGLLITLVNIVAGIVIGVSYHGMSAGEAANRFSVLSIGDAMVSQVPSLLISVAAGILITRVANEHGKPRSLGMEIALQLSSNARALFGAAALLCGFALVPGFPSTLFVLLAALLFGGALVLQRKQRGEQRQQGPELAALRIEGARSEAPSITSQAPSFAAPLALKLSTSLGQQLDHTRLNRAFETIRHALVNDLGLPFPRIALWTTDELPPLSYQLLLHDVPQAPVALAGNTASSSGSSGSSGFETALTDAVYRTVKSVPQQFFGLQETQWMLEHATNDFPGLVAEVQKVVSTLRVSEVLKRLLEEQVPIRNLRSILESLVAWGAREKDPLLLTEYVRNDLGSFIVHRATAGSNQLHAIVLDPAVEQMIRDAIRQTPTGNFITLDPEQIERLVEDTAALARAHPEPGLAVVTSMDVRRYFRRMLERHLPGLQVYSFQELGEVELQTVGCVGLPHSAALADPHEAVLAT
ncbi:FHIPEP family type III secretion protein [Paraburkholderia bonniea]|uniref:FHIPEP family type III secretion protein n=1 Tax=Paraburkholderia bonniea TaxID=2152891 RepID=UPI0025727878|nr:FHIPEP family type III secretion protein [Paraburkholderia bonniea]WJF89347.1 FHIPEP family type III secretion protein [Paraburkholderia bonniea]WJF94742.1 FHIPEP family type III secretion protein [Paraburkholderia bonniea]